MSAFVENHPSPKKKRRLSLNPRRWSNPVPDAPGQTNYHNDGAAVSRKGTNEGHTHPNDGTTISMSTNSRLAGQTVAPFLHQHIPNQYAPLGGPPVPGKPANANPNTKYCYRHRPDLKCRRQADEPSMDQLQHVCVPSLSKYMDSC